MSKNSVVELGLQDIRVVSGGLLSFHDICSKKSIADITKFGGTFDFLFLTVIFATSAIGLIVVGYFAGKFEKKNACNDESAMGV